MTTDRPPSSHTQPEADPRTDAPPPDAALADAPPADGPPEAVLAAWGLMGAREVTRLTVGLINHTFLVRRGGQRLVLQRLSPIFGPEVNLDIDALTGALAAAGVLTPRLERTVTGDAWFEDARGRVWRALTFVPGHTVDRVDTPARALGAGTALGRFHRALWHSEHTFHHRRPGVHDTPRHLAALRRALDDHRRHPAHAEAEALGEAILELAGRFTLPGDLPERVVHGDPKITNVMFDHAGRAVALVDLDTMARMPLCLELGDALRSWCDPAGEDVSGPFEMNLARAALQGHAAALGPLLGGEERRAIAPAVPLICAELAARFCADALCESYFGWDPARFPSASAHNLARTRSQLALARSAAAQLSDLERIVDDAKLPGPAAET